ncbi:MAG: FAD-linked oxidase C-terminal domain-containing protein [Acidobacteriota bacterium]
MPVSSAPPLPQDLVTELDSLLGERLSQSESVLDLHGRDESYFPPTPPQAVAFPRDTLEVQQIVRSCGRHGVPLVPFGAGSSVEGHVLPIHGGISLDLTGMNRILAVHPQDLDVTVQAGVTRLQLEKALAEHGLFFPVDPGADATLGGMIATGASGTTAVRYGTMRENVLCLEVVLANGEVVRTGTRAKKSSSGYDLTRLMIGSEGTLGVITEATLRVRGIPEGISAAVCSFRELGQAVQAAVEVIQWGIPVARVELLDAVQIAAVNQHSGLDHPEQPTLFFEFHGSPTGVEEHARAAAKIAAEHGGEGFRWATDAGERHRLWHARHEAYFADLALRPGARVMSTDVCVPISRLAECITETQVEIDRASFPVPIVGHVGDGNFHLLLVIDPSSEAEIEEAKALNRSLVERALRMGGTSTGEHGVGLGKQDWMTLEHGPALDTMRAIKQALDPHGILNPGKILPPVD